MTDDLTPSLYVHIPFCRSKCPYCGFFSTTATASLPAFLKALHGEMDFYREDFRYFDTLYLGGGTPSLLTADDLSALLAAVTTRFTLLPQAEITLEANPADLDRPYLHALRRLGINRLNIGIQSFDDNILRFLGRRHDRRQAILAIEAAREAGFENLGLDLIYGVPGQDIGPWLENLHQALSFRPAHLSCYQLTMEPHTPLQIRHLKDDFSLPDEDGLSDFFFQTSATLREAGYLHYEISNFAVNEASLSRHNQKYWRHAPYLGLGPSAHSFLGNKRWWNHRDVGAYTDSVARDLPPREAEEVLTPDQLRLEAWLLGVRTRRGIDLKDFQRRYNYEILVEKGPNLRSMAEKRLLEIRDGFLRPTLAGMAVADSLALL